MSKFIVIHGETNDGTHIHVKNVVLCETKSQVANTLTKVRESHPTHDWNVFVDTGSGFTRAAVTYPHDVFRIDIS